MVDDPFENFLKFHPYPHSIDDITNETSASMLVSEVFKEIEKRFGEGKARAMFAPYARTLNNKDRTIRKNAGLIWQLYYMDKPNISELARKHAGNGKNGEEKFEAWRKQIHRALNDKEARIMVSAESIELLGYSILPDSEIFGMSDPRITDDMLIEWGLMRPKNPGPEDK